MLNLRQLAVSGGIAVGLAAAAATAYAGPDKDHKVALCHMASERFVVISVAEQAVPAHMAKGDVMLDDYGECPGQ